MAIIWTVIDKHFQDVRTGDSGMLQVNLDGINLKFGKGMMFFNIRSIRKCNTVKGKFLKSILE